MALNSNVLESAQSVLIEYLHTNDGLRLIENFQKLTKEDEGNVLLNNLKGMMIEINNWNIKAVQSIIDQTVLGIKDENFKNILKIYKEQLILLLFDQIIEKTEDIKLKIQTLINKIPILSEALQLSKKINDSLLVKKYLEQNTNNFITLGLYAIYSENIESAIKFFGEILEPIQEFEDNFPKQNSFLLRILSNLFLKMRNNPELFKISKNILNLDPAEQHPYQIAFKFIKRAISIDEKENYSPGLALDYYNLALIYYEQNMIKQAIQEIKTAQKLHEQLNNREGILNDVILLGTLISKIKKGDEALQIYNNALNIASDLELKNKIAELNLLIGILLYDDQNYEDSLKHLKTSLVIFKQGQIGNNVDLIESYSWIGQTLREMQNVDEAKQFLMKILEVEKKSESTTLLMHIHSQLAITYIQLSNQDEFNKNYQKILSLYEQNKDEFQYSNLEYQIGITFCNQQKFQEGLIHLGKAFQIYHKIQNKEKIELILQTLSLVYHKINKSNIAETISDINIDVMKRSQIVFEKGDIIDLKIPKIPTTKEPSGRLCPQCGFLITNPEFAFCPKCAIKLRSVLICQKCGFKVENSDFHFCPKCANPLD